MCTYEEQREREKKSQMQFKTVKLTIDTIKSVKFNHKTDFKKKKNISSSKRKCVFFKYAVLYEGGTMTGQMWPVKQYSFFFS